MTTICWDGKIFAADSQTSGKGIVICERSKKLYVLPYTKYYNDHLLAIASCGDVAALQKFTHHLEHTDDLALMAQNGDFQSLIIGRKFVYLLLGDNLAVERYPRNTKLSIGSGAQFGLSAMYLGKDAIQAVKHAAILDAFTNNRTTHLKL